MSFPKTLDLAAIRGVTYDLDGVVWRDADTLPGVPELFRFLHAEGIPYVAVTNNSTRTIAEFVTRIDALGIPIDGEHVITSAALAADVLAREYPPGTPIYVIGSPSLQALLTARGHVIDPVQAQVVIVGLDTGLTYEKLVIAGGRIMAGAAFIGTNADATFPMPGYIAPGNGSILAALEKMTGRAPRVLGKPEPAMFQAALARLGVRPEQALMIGDRLDTDILGAQRVGMRTALVLSGVSVPDDLGRITPDAVFEDLADLHQRWLRAVAHRSES